VKKDKNFRGDLPKKIRLARLKKQLENVDKLPLWRLHPAVQHCLRLLQGYYPFDVERYSEDDQKWVKNSVPPGMMFAEVYRVPPEKFNFDFLRNNASPVFRYVVVK